MNPISDISSYLWLDRCESDYQHDKPRCLYHDPERKSARTAERVAVRKIRTSIADILETCFVREVPSFKTHLDACMDKPAMLPPPTVKDMPDLDSVRKFVESCLFSIDVVEAAGIDAACAKEKVKRVRKAIYDHVEDFVLPHALLVQDVTEFSNQAEKNLSNAIERNINESKKNEICFILDRIDYIDE